MGKLFYSIQSEILTIHDKEGMEIEFNLTNGKIQTYHQGESGPTHLSWDYISDLLHNDH